MDRFLKLFRPYARFLLAIWVILIIILAVLPEIPVPRIVKGRFDFRLDYPVHYLEHTSLAILAIISFITGRLRDQYRRVLSVLALLILFAIASEILQLAIPARSFELRDMGINILGSLTGTLFTMILYRKARE